MLINSIHRRTSSVTFPSAIAIRGASRRSHGYCLCVQIMHSPHSHGPCWHYRRMRAIGGIITRLSHSLPPLCTSLASYQPLQNRVFHCATPPLATCWRKAEVAKIAANAISTAPRKKGEPGNMIGAAGEVK